MSAISMQNIIPDGLVVFTWLTDKQFSNFKYWYEFLRSILSTIEEEKQLFLFLNSWKPKMVTYLPSGIKKSSNY